jgi:hypothetical protein
LIWSGQFLFHETAYDAGFERGQFNIHKREFQWS